jgi:uncharacterized membrane protein YdjX (TVP38/TMEM64 family)
VSRTHKRDRGDDGAITDDELPADRHEAEPDMSPSPEPSTRSAALLCSPRLRLAVLAVVLVGASVAVATLGDLRQGQLEETVAATGAAGPIVYIVLYAVLTVLFFPGAVITAAGGVLFGTAFGTLWAVVGASIGAVAAFFIGRKLGRAQVEAIAGRRMGAVDEWLERRGLVAILYLRLIPLVPFNALNYVAGVTALGRRDYAVGTVLGIIPGAFAFAALGSSIENPTSPEFLGAVGLVGLLIIAGPIVNRVTRARGTGPPQT